MDQQTSNVIYSTKALAVLSIICAHVTPLNPSFGSAHVNSVSFLSIFGSIGVGIFYFFSGFFLASSKKQFTVFWKTKIKSIVLPWVICGTLVYVYQFVHKGERASVTDWFYWLIGNGTYLYYLTCLIVFYCICFPFRNKKATFFVLCIVSLISIMLTIFSDILSNYNPYLNPLNFGIWFAIGALVFLNNALDSIVCFFKNHIILVVVFSVSLLLLVCTIAFSSINYDYFKVLYIPCETFAIFASLGFGFVLSRFSLFVDIGKQSFAIYLLHYPVAGAITYLSNKVDFWLVTVLRGMIVLSVTYSVIWTIHRISKPQLKC